MTKYIVQNSMGYSLWVDSPLADNPFDTPKPAIEKAKKLSEGRNVTYRVVTRTEEIEIAAFKNGTEVE